MSAQTAPATSKVELRLRWVLLAFVAVAYTLAYLGYSALPGNDPQAPRGWWGWWDQQQYLKSATAIANWALGKESYWYPLGYPALAAPFIGLAPLHAFFIPNIALVLASAWLLWLFARRYFSALETIGLAIAFVAFHRWLLASSLVVPWNTLPVQVALYAAIVALLVLPAHRAAVAIAALVAACLWFRPLDTLAFGPLLAGALWLVGDRPRRLRTAGFVAAIVAASWFAQALSKLAVFGSLTSPYELNSLRIGFGSWPLEVKLFWLLADGGEFFASRRPGLMLAYPWLLLAPAGLVFLARREGLKGWAIGLAILVSVLTYVQYNDWLPWNIYAYLLVHYVAWFFPLLFILAWAVLRRAGPVGLAAAGGSALILCMLVLGLRYEPQAPRALEGQPFAIGPQRPLMLEWQQEKYAVHRLEMATEARPLKRFRDFLDAGQGGMARALLSPSAPGDSLTMGMDGHRPQRLSARAFSWSWGFDLTRVRDYLPEALVFRVAFPVASQSDLAGPAGEPDGKKDVEVTITGIERLLSQVEVWDVHILEGVGKWTSARGQKQWWMITVAKPSEGLRKLHFADNGRALEGKMVVVVGLRKDGSELLKARAKRPP